MTFDIYVQLLNTLNQTTYFVGIRKSIKLELQIVLNSLAMKT